MTGVMFSGLIILILLGTVLGYISAKQGLIRNKKLLENVCTAACLIFVCGLTSAWVWFTYAGPINEFLLFGGVLFIILLDTNSYRVSGRMRKENPDKLSIEPTVQN